ncbi:MAG: hypothetical protein L0L75_03760, partial [Enterobacterales bacterium]|nr:hypothetical protein [Enterobacterales bacterium]
MQTLQHNNDPYRKYFYYTQNNSSYLKYDGYIQKRRHMAGAVSLRANHPIIHTQLAVMAYRAQKLLTSILAR